LKYWLLVDKDSIKILVYSILACLLFVCFDVIFQYFNYKYVSEIVSLNSKLNISQENLIKKGFDIFGYASKDYSRFQGPFNDEYIAGGFILKLSPFLLLITFNILKLRRNSFSKILIFLSATLIIFSIFITGDRAPFFMLILISSLLILLFVNKKIILIFLSSLILIIFLLGINLDKKQRYINESLSALGFQNNEFTLDTGYGHLFYSAIKIWIDKPLIGVGTKNYRKICDRDEYNFETKNNHQLCSTHPHNYVLELLSETGLMGLISFYLIFFYLVRDFELVKKILQKNLDHLNIKFSIISLFVILWPISTTGSILTNKSSIVLWFVFGIIYSAISIEKKSHFL
jgi:O-antigen ligase